MIHRTPRVVRPASLGPREADDAHHVLPPQPPSAPPALDAFTLLALWRPVSNGWRRRQRRADFE